MSSIQLCSIWLAVTSLLVFSLHHQYCRSKAFFPWQQVLLLLLLLLLISWTISGLSSRLSGKPCLPGRRCDLAGGGRLAAIVLSSGLFSAGTSWFVLCGVPCPLHAACDSVAFRDSGAVNVHYNQHMFDLIDHQRSPTLHPCNRPYAPNILIMVYWWLS